MKLFFNGYIFDGPVFDVLAEVVEFCFFRNLHKLVRVCSSGCNCVGRECLCKCRA